MKMALRYNQVTGRGVERSGNKSTEQVDAFRFPHLKTKRYNPERDLTFSLGREVSYSDVLELLSRYGCVDLANVHETILNMHIGNNVNKMQVILTCAKDGINDGIVDILINAPDCPVVECYSFSNKEVVVKFSYKHPTVDVENEIRKIYLEGNHGKVIRWWRHTETKYRIPTGTVSFLMWENDLKAKPIPGKVFINGIPAYVYYKGQTKICFRCKGVGHFARECPGKTDQVHYAKR